MKLNLKLVSPAGLCQFMEYRGMSVRTLAERVGCSHSTIGHLRTGERRYVRAAWAKRIEQALDAPRGSLFVVEVSSLSREPRVLTTSRLRPAA